MLKKIFGILLSLLSVAVIIQLTKTDVDPTPNAKGKSFISYVEYDLSELRSSKKLPRGWDSIKMVTFSPTDSEQKPYMRNIRSLFPTDDKGALELSIDVVEIEDKDLKSVILQMSLIDISSKNKIWELGRTYQLNGNY